MWLRVVAAAVLIVNMMGCATSRSAPRNVAPPDDQTLKMRVQTSLLNTAGVHANEVTTEVTGAVVTLSGILHSQAEIDAAIAAARRVEGLKDVRSTLRVQ
jgi:osmotically-inducible protein OsmY